MGETGRDHRACPRPLALPFGPELRALLTDEVRHKQEDIFAWHRGGPLAVPGPIRRCQLCPRPTARPHPPARRIGCANCAQDPAAPGRTQMLQLAAGRSMGRPRCARGAGGGARTPPFLWADAGLHPLGRRYSLQLLSLLLSCARLPGTYSSALVLAKLEKGGGEKKKGLKKMAPAPLRSACFLFLLFSPPLSIGSYQSTGGGEGQRNINAE